ncbi:hypothetical protein Btru_062167 [Bulinus truncatus]|nr:hypothetical protein Btru_062167 [Bulinus truncatus]
MKATAEDSMDSETASNGWRIEEPDEGRYNFSDEKSVWQPKPEDILLIFDKIEQAKGSPLSIKWTCPGRKVPERQDKHNNGVANKTDKDGEECKDAEHRAPESSTFDFDEFQSDVSAKLTPRSVPGTVTPRQEKKKVARMEDIMTSLRKQQLQRAADREAAKKKSSLGASPARSRLLNFRAADPRYGSAKMLSFSPGGRPDTSKTLSDESALSQPNTPTVVRGEGVCNTSTSKSLFTDSTINSGVSDISLESRSLKHEPEIEKQLVADLANAVHTSEECLTVSAEPSPPLDTIKPVITNLNDLKESDSITVIEKSPPPSDFSHPAVPCTVLNLEQFSSNNEDSASKDSSVHDTLQPEFNPSSMDLSVAEHLTTSSSSTVIPPEISLPVVSSSQVSLSASEDTVRPATITELENLDTEITNNDETITNST